MYVKLFASMLSSTIWFEDAATRITWITLLLLADQDGYVRGFPKGLAHIARLPEEEVEHALRVLSREDEHSHTKEHSGRRIEEVEGGWMILNYGKYRTMRDADTVRAQTRERVRRHRERKRAEADAVDVSPDDDDFDFDGVHRDQTPEALQEDVTQEALPESEDDFPFDGGNADSVTSALPVTHSNAPKRYAEAEAEEEKNYAGSRQRNGPSGNGEALHRNAWKGEAAKVLLASGVPEAKIGDAIRNWWTAARRRFTDAEIADVVLATGKRFRERGDTSWLPQAVWNPRNENFDSRFRWAISQESKKKRGGSGIKSLAEHMGKRGLQ